MMRINSFLTNKPAYSCPQPSLLQSVYRDSASSLPSLYTSVSSPELLMVVTLSSSSFFPIILPLYIELSIIFFITGCLINIYISKFISIAEKEETKVAYKRRHSIWGWLTLFEGEHMTMVESIRGGRQAWQ